MLRTVVEIDEGKGTVDVEVSDCMDTPYFNVMIEESDGSEVNLRASADLLRDVAVRILESIPGERLPIRWKYVEQQGETDK